MATEDRFMRAEDLYLDLLKKSLTYTLWPEPPTPIERYNHVRSAPKRFLFSLASRFLGVFGFGLVRHNASSDASRREGRTLPLHAETMIGLARLDNIQFCVEDVLGRGVPGDLIETGVWRGGAAIFLRAVLAAHGVSDRRVWVADSFRGLPPAPRPGDRYWPKDHDVRLDRNPLLAVSRREVEANFARYNLLDEQVVFLEGWFEQTLPAAPIQSLAVLRLDGDMYASTMDVLIHLYPKLSPGGFLIVDDFALDGCRNAVEDYRAKHKIDAPIERVDWTGIYWRKD